MAATELPGLGDVLSWGTYLGVPGIEESVRRAQLLMLTDPAAVRAGGERLGTVASGLDTGRQDIALAGNDLAAGMRGLLADAIGPHSAEVARLLAGAGEEATRLAADLDRTATAFLRSQETVVAATGATATALRMLAV